MHRHTYIECDKKGYEYCPECGTYHSYMQVDPKTIYQDNEYWTYAFNRSKIEEQLLNLQSTDENTISKVDKVLEYVPKGGKSALEIACAPGVMLKKLTDLGFDTLGVEPSDRYIDFILSQSPKSAILHGFFPDVFKGIEMQFDCIIGLDILEHINFYEPFLSEVDRLLKPNGVAIFMSPVILKDGLYRERDFEHPDEHAYIFSEDFLSTVLLQRFGIGSYEFSRWIVGHELIIIRK